jgi:hypothetical protein
MGTAFRTLLGLLCSVAYSLLVALLAWKLAGWLAGANVSDVGVRMYARGLFAIAGGIASYLALTALAMALAARVARVANPTLWAFGLGAAVVFLAFAVLLFFEYA